MRKTDNKKRMKKFEKAEFIMKHLEMIYPNTPIPLKHESIFELLIAVLLSAQCTDERVNKVTPHSFRPGLAGDMRRAGLRLEDIALECRWHGMRNARMYSERASLTASRSSSRVRLLQY